MWEAPRLRIGTRVSSSSSFSLSGGKTERLVGLCEQLGADVYVSGPSAAGYLDVSLFAQAGMSVGWFHYDGFADYPQPWGPFQASVSIVDVMFNCGAASSECLRIDSKKPKWSVADAARSGQQSIRGAELEGGE